MRRGQDHRLLAATACVREPDGDAHIREAAPAVGCRHGGEDAGHAVVQPRLGAAALGEVLPSRGAAERRLQPLLQRRAAAVVVPVVDVHLVLRAVVDGVRDQHAAVRPTPAPGDAEEEVVGAGVAPVDVLHAPQRLARHHHVAVDHTSRAASAHSVQVAARAPIVLRGRACVRRLHDLVRVRAPGRLLLCNSRDVAQDTVPVHTAPRPHLVNTVELSNIRGDIRRDIRGGLVGRTPSQARQLRQCHGHHRHGQARRDLRQHGLE
mmetsp:Transcript_54769/g.158460  ORF Transcript_54769/g.158460 Transcript_54769/m.158460 type:complete len:264 (+) Transcript_54769:160-951(+)